MNDVEELLVLKRSQIESTAGGIPPFVVPIEGSLVV